MKLILRNLAYRQRSVNIDCGKRGSDESAAQRVDMEGEVQADL